MTKPSGSVDANGDAGWARPFSNEAAFAGEQEAFGTVWTLLGLKTDVARDGDWFTAKLGGRSIFVQQFKGAIKAFENKCAHRFFPLRNADKGNGPVVCGFHHWRYDQDGRAMGVPMCPEMFGVTPRKLDARLRPVEIATCGSLIFGRFPDAGARETLAEYLGDAFPILEVMCTVSRQPNRHSYDIEANWRLCVEITLDDYHIVAVHARPSHHTNDELQYFRFGLHSAHFEGNADTLASMAADCRNNRYRPVSYRIFNIFPNLAVSLFRATPYWYFHIQQFVPISPKRCRVRHWFSQTGFPADEETRFHRLIRPFSEPLRTRIVRYYMDKIGYQDHRACERLQTVAHQIDGRPILGAQEKRIEWFEEAYRHALEAERRYSRES